MWRKNQYTFMEINFPSHCSRWRALPCIQSSGALKRPFRLVVKKKTVAYFYGRVKNAWQGPQLIIFMKNKWHENSTSNRQLSLPRPLSAHKIMIFSEVLNEGRLINVMENYWVSSWLRNFNFVLMRVMILFFYDFIILSFTFCSTFKFISM